MFNENSQLAIIWVNLIQTEIYTEKDVPSLFNLKEVVSSLLLQG